jgi:hypothetical protein
LQRENAAAYEELVKKLKLKQAKQFGPVEEVDVEPDMEEIHDEVEA